MATVKQTKPANNEYQTQTVFSSLLDDVARQAAALQAERDAARDGDFRLYDGQED